MAAEDKTMADTKDKDKETIKAAVERKKKEMVLNMRINRDDLEAIKQKARKAGIKYQTLISEILHRFAKA